MLWQTALEQSAPLFLHTLVRRIRGCGGTAYTRDLKSRGLGSCGFKSRHPHQMRECWNRQTGTFEVRVLRRVGSSPTSRTIYAAVVELADTGVLEALASACRFKSCQQYHYICGNSEVVIIPPVGGGVLSANLNFCLDRGVVTHCKISPLESLRQV